MRSVLFLSASVILLCAAAQAATLVEIRDQEGLTRIFNEGSWYHLEMPGKNGYMVLDASARSLHAVMPAERMVMDMSDTLRTAPAATPDDGIDIRLQEQGPGPRIAGYKTVRYRYSANGQPCGTLFTSLQARDDTGLNAMFVMLEQLSAQAEAMMGAFTPDRADPCDSTDLSLSKITGQVGAPLRMLDDDGETLTEVVRIDKNAVLPANAFIIPADYRHYNTRQMLQGMMPWRQQ